MYYIMKGSETARVKMSIADKRLDGDDLFSVFLVCVKLSQWVLLDVASAGVSSVKYPPD